MWIKIRIGRYVPTGISLARRQDNAAWCGMSENR